LADAWRAPDDGDWPRAWNERAPANPLSYSECSGYVRVSSRFLSGGIAVPEPVDHTGLAVVTGAAAARPGKRKAVNASHASLCRFGYKFVLIQ